MRMKLEEGVIICMRLDLVRKVFFCFVFGLFSDIGTCTFLSYQCLTDDRWHIKIDHHILSGELVLSVLELIEPTPVACAFGL